jgi:hypothetical protein
VFPPRCLVVRRRDHREAAAFFHRSRVRDELILRHLRDHREGAAGPFLNAGLRLPRARLRARAKCGEREEGKKGRTVHDEQAPGCWLPIVA